MEGDALIWLGSKVKALDDGTLEGYLVRWGSPDDRDLEGEFFTQKTFLGHQRGNGSIAMVHHGIPLLPGYEDYARKALTNPVKVVEDEVGALASVLMEMSDTYEAMLHGLGKKGKLSWSSGAVPYGVEIDRKTGEILRWPISEASLTPMPAEPRNRVTALKTYMESLEDREPEDGSSAPSEPEETPASEVTETVRGVTDMKKFKVGSGWVAYNVDDAGLKTGNPLQSFTEEADMDTWLADQKKAPWEHAIERNEALVAKLLQAQVPRGDGAGQSLVVDPTKAFAQLARPLQWSTFLKAWRDKDRTALTNMGSLPHGKTPGTKDITERTGEQGGYLVPDILMADFFRLDPESEVVWPRARVIPMSSRSAHFPTLRYDGNTAGTSNFFGGFTFSWTETGSEKDETELEFGQVKLETHESSAYTELHEDVVRHSVVNLVELVSGVGRAAYMFYTDEDFLDGNGVGKPLGIINAPATLTVARAGAGAFTYVDAVNMIQLMLPGSYSNAVWICNPLVITELLTMVDPNGNYVWQPSARDGIDHPLFGRPVIFTEKTPALGTTGDVILADLRYYYIGQGMEVFVATSDHYQFRDNKIAMKIVGYVDGQPVMESAVYLKDGATQVSPFVMLDDAAS